MTISSKTTSDVIVGTIHVIQQDNNRIPIRDSYHEKKPDITQDIENHLNINQESNSYLKIETIQKMIHRFLVEKQMPKEKLAEILEISVKELEQFFYQAISPELMLKINLPLIKLYCETKWI